MLNAVFTVLFPKNLKYFDDLINSINNQTIQDFDLIIINDGVDSYYLEQKKTFLKCSCKIFTVNGQLSFGKIREFGIQQTIKDGYENIIFVDSDDTMSIKRVELSLIGLKNYPIVFNDLTLINNKGIPFKENIWKNRLINEVINKNFILDKNVIGLGNSAVRTNLLENIIIPNRIIATDWYIFSKIIKDYEACFMSGCVTYYRQHEFNTIGFQESITADRLNYVLSVKEMHYSALSSDDLIYEILLNRTKLLQGNIESQQLEYINNLNINFFWWEESNHLQS